MTEGQRVKVTVRGQEYKGTVMICSDNRKSLAVTPDEGLFRLDGALVNFLALLGDGDSKYRDLFTNVPVELVWL